jgi:hypothetical protein
MECKYAIRLQNFPYRLCKLQQEAPVGCNLMPMYEECQILKEYNIDTSAGYPINEGSDIVRYSFEKRRVKDKEL